LRGAGIQVGEEGRGARHVRVADMRVGCKTTSVQAFHDQYPPFGVGFQQLWNEPRRGPVGVGEKRCLSLEAIGGKAAGLGVGFYHHCARRRLAGENQVVCAAGERGKTRISGSVTQGVSRPSLHLRR
jgi:hypothetical protein